MAEENTNVQGTEEPAGTPGTPPEKTFTQAEVDALIGRRVARALKGMPGEEELTAFRNWQKEHKDNDGTVAALTRERDDALAKLEQSERERFLLKKGIPEADVDYYCFKIGKIVTEELPFDKAAEKFLKENGTNKVRVDMSAKLTGSRAGENANDAMNALIRGAR